MTWLARKYGLLKSQFFWRSGGDGNARRTYVIAFGLDAGDDGIEVHLLPHQLHAQLVGNGLHQCGLDTHDLAAIQELKGREVRAGGHHQLLLFAVCPGVCIGIAFAAAGSHSQHHRRAQKQAQEFGKIFHIHSPFLLLYVVDRFKVYPTVVVGKRYT